MSQVHNDNHSLNVANSKCFNCVFRPGRVYTNAPFSHLNISPKHTALHSATIIHISTVDTFGCVCNTPCYEKQRFEMKKKNTSTHQ